MVNCARRERGTPNEWRRSGRVYIFFLRFFQKAVLLAGLSSVVASFFISGNGGGVLPFFTSLGFSSFPPPTVVGTQPTGWYIQVSCGLDVMM